MVITPVKEYNITETHTNKLKRASIAHEWNKKSNVLGKKYADKKKGWKPIKEEPPVFTVGGSGAPTLADMARNGGD